MARTCYVGETVRITAKDLTHASSGPVTVGATVTIKVYDPTGALLSTNAGVASGDDWYFDVTMPATAGQCRVSVVATVAGATAKDDLYLTVRPFI